MEKDFRYYMKKFYEALAKNRAKNIVIVILLLTTIFGAYQYARAQKLRRDLNNTYNRAFFDMVGYVQNVQIMLMKAQMISTPELSASTLRDIWREADMAANNLGQLPVSFGVLANTEKFLYQVSDLSQSISKHNTTGKVMNADQIKTLKNLHGFSVSLENSLNELKDDLSSGNFKWENVSREGTKTFSETSKDMPKTFSSISQNFQEVPTLIYDGPFSEHMQNRKALGLSGNKVTEAQAVENLKKFMGGTEKVGKIQKLADNKNNIINTYNFKMELSGKKDSKIAEGDVSVTGGHVVWYLYNRNVGKPTVSIDKAKEIGRKFLDSKGYANMKDTYYLEHNNVATINYAYTANGVTYYSDLIKVKVALDDGEVVGFEANGYLMSHTTRNAGTPKLTQAQARAKVIRGDSIKNSGLAVIPTNFGTEILCYEFIGKLENKDFLVYINANTGVEEQVLMIINSNEGVLTM
jgi:germination protein YpeB